jgi:hypothetical protein
MILELNGVKLHVKSIELEPVLDVNGQFTFEKWTVTCHDYSNSPVYYLDCFSFGSMLGHEFPVNTYGPATLDQCEDLRDRLTGFDKMRITKRTKCQNSMPSDKWPGMDRPR